MNKLRTCEIVGRYNSVTVLAQGYNEEKVATFEPLNGTGKVAKCRGRHSALKQNMRNNTMYKPDLVKVVRGHLESLDIPTER